jgi:hypothetical protein
LVEVSPDVKGPDCHEKNTPTSVSPDAALDLLLVEDKSNENRANNLRDPIEQIIQ